MRTALLVIASMMFMSACEAPTTPAERDLGQSNRVEASESISARPTSRWSRFSELDLWSYIVRHDTTITVGIKNPTALRGFFGAKMLLDDEEYAAARQTFVGVAGVSVVDAHPILPALRLKVGSLEALEQLFRSRFIDYV